MNKTGFSAFLKKIIDYVLDLRCIFCNDRNLNAEIGFVCDKCLNAFLTNDTETAKCPVCSHPLKNSFTCPSCSAIGKIYYDSYSYIQYYTDFFRNAAVMWKKNESFLVNVLFFKLLLKKRLLSKDIPITVVPDDFAKRFKKGRSSLDYLLKLLKKEGYKTLPNIYKKKSFLFKSQKSKTKNQRINEIEKTFFLPEKNVNKFDDEVFLLDDIYTTGSTLNYGSKLLKEAGFKKVHIVSFFRTIIE